MIDGRRASWDAALAAAAEGFTRIAAEHGPDAVAFYLSGQLLTEDYYVANKLMKGFIGSGNVDTNSRLCMASSVAGHRRAFGADTVPGCYEDLDEADLVVLVGSNAAWCHPILFRRMLDARARRGTKIVVVDPRRTATGDEADLCTCRSSPARTRRCSAVCSCISPRPERSTATSSRAIRRASPRRSHARARSRRRPRRRRGRRAFRRPPFRLFMNCSPRRSEPSPASRKA